MEIKPLVTEKSLARSKIGKYSFVVPESFTSGKAKDIIESTFSVKVRKVWTINHPGESFMSRSRRKMEKSASKVIIVSLKEGKIDIFDVSPEKSNEKKAEPNKVKSGGSK
jgi:ribosomal protein L23